MALYSNLYTAAQVRELDRCAIEDFGLPSSLLMKRAGQAAFDYLLKQWPQPGCLEVFCGGGNNGGDGYVVAALAAQRKLPVRIWQLATRLDGEAQLAYEYALQENVNIQRFSCEAWQDAIADNNQSCIIVDALLGTGAIDELREPYPLAIEAMNRSGWPILALDVPSGINADKGSSWSVYIQATATISFIGQKLGNLVGTGRVASGRRWFADLGVPQALYQTSRQQPRARVLELEHLLCTLPKRALDAHKGHFGHLLVVGGDSGFGGAPLLAAQMAARCGSGLVGVATRPEYISAILSRQPEIMASAVVSGQELFPLLERATVLVVGPGLGQSAWSEQLLHHSVQAKKPIIVDADGLNLLAQGKIKLPDNRQWILTPHPGEAARLLCQSIAEIQADRVAAVQALQQSYGGTIVLKGAGTLIMTASGELFVCDAGNPAMASGGMGDVLSGLIGSLVAQGLSMDNAACLGVLLHSVAADRVVADQGVYGLLATDLIQPVHQLLQHNLSIPSLTTKLTVSTNKASDVE